MGKIQVKVDRQTMLQRSVDENLVQLGFQAIPETFAQTEQACRLFRHLFLRDFAGLAEADDPRDVQRAGTHAALVPPAVDDGGKLDAGIAAANGQNANALGPVNLVAADGQQVDVVLLDVDRDFTQGLYAVHG